MLYLGAGGAVLIVLVCAGLIAMLRRKRKPAATGLAAGQKEIPGAASEPAAVLESLKEQMEAKLAENERAKEQQQIEALRALQLPTVKTQKTEVLTKHLSAETKKDPAAMAHVIRAWLSEQ